MLYLLLGIANDDLQSAYETLYAILEPLLPILPRPLYYDRIIAGITDDHDIRAICLLCFTKLLTIAPIETQQRLGDVAAAFKQVLSIKPRESSVKTEIERMQDGYVGVIKASLAVQRTFNTTALDDGRAAAHTMPMLDEWISYWNGVQKNMENLVRFVEQDEMRERDH